MKKLILIAMLTATLSQANAGTRTDPVIVKSPENIYYKYSIVTSNSGKKNVSYHCFTGYPNNPHTNKTQNWLALGYKKGSIGLNSAMVNLCRNHIMFHTNAGIK